MYIHYIHTCTCIITYLHLDTAKTKLLKQLEFLLYNISCFMSLLNLQSDCI